MLPPNIKGLLSYFLLVKNIVLTEMSMLKIYFFALDSQPFFYIFFIISFTNFGASDKNIA